MMANLFVNMVFTKVLLYAEKCTLGVSEVWTSSNKNSPLGSNAQIFKLTKPGNVNKRKMKTNEWHKVDMYLWDYITQEIHSQR